MTAPSIPMERTARAAQRRQQIAEAGLVFLRAVDAEVDAHARWTDGDEDADWEGWDAEKWAALDRFAEVLGVHPDDFGGEDEACQFAYRAAAAMPVAWQRTNRI